MPPEPDNFLPCPNCRHPIGPEAPGCPSCGYALWERRFWNRPVQVRIAAYADAEPGKFGRRLVAFLIDSALMLLFFIVTWPIVSGESIVAYYDSIFSYEFTFAVRELTFRAGNLYNSVRDIIYYTATIAIWRATVGMWVCRLRVLRTDGSRVGVVRALARYLASVLSMLPLGYGYVLITFREDKRALHDIICDTVVIRRANR